MFLNILKKDLRRKKTMNLVLLVLITLATALIASGTNLTYTTTSAIGYFIDKSRVADHNVTIPDTPENRQKISDWSAGQSIIAEVVEELQIGVTSREVSLPAGRKGFSSSLVLTLATVPDKVNLIYDHEDQRFTLKEGEIGIPVSIKNATGMELGDSIRIDFDGISKIFKLTHIFKDAYMGADLLGLKRLVISQQDFADIKDALPEEAVMVQYSFVAAAGVESAAVTAAFAKQDLAANVQIDKGVVRMSYMTDQIISAMLFVISLFLIFIAFMTLRFTIVSTLQDEYREIGVMKAIGFKNGPVKRLYLAKYLGLAVTGGTFGLLASFPLTALMSRKTSEYIILPGGIANIVISITSAIAVILLTLLFCLLCMRTINKASAIDAIRQGHTGERFQPSRSIHLHRSKRLHPMLFLALSDILSRLKSYTTLILTFILSTAIIIIPINLTNTILTPKFISYLGTTEADFYTKSVVAEKPLDEIRGELVRVEQEFKERQFDVKLSLEYTILTKYISEDGESNRSITGTKNEPMSELEFLQGSAPKLANEIAITSIMSEVYDKGLGDYITFEIDGQQHSFLITGIFQAISNEGYMVRLAEQFNPQMTMSYMITGMIHAADKDKAAITAEMKQVFSKYEIKTADEMLAEIIGGFVGQLKSVISLLTVIVCLIIFFITSLFVRLLISKEIQGIAVMKSLGFTDGLIRLWQVLRIMILLTGSLIIGVLGANILGERLFGFVFRMFGLTELHFQIMPLQVYVLYPLIILAVVVIAVYTSCGQIKRIHVWNMNKE
ncbi:hypothetical protein R70723_15410 [Paenibacillus sp. FSL R7-0273]|uniref:ABC transporter permease n=1 Tax=Paenibacillus sp. FSL R7-0273 TaxID=1536772 RepID=UPI0004F83534|nr:FtsX-like permease family protein [Paenibacillus sp. FSL R7-0273]AIQ47116.1 hypothetical protein R70723_15410 [Paenibacillus sp. FSL R7-0273]OMF97129.1 hypothetical protein BK144_00235 [Paenibacillus sp. FSL R7-0273]